MSKKPFSPQLHMLRSGLSGLPEVSLPPGYELRTYRPGDAAEWCRVISESFEREYGVEDFDRQMRRDYAFRPERIFFVEADDGVVATASAWYRPAWGRMTGYVHMVGVRPGHSGKRLGYWVSLATLHRFVEEGRTSARLDTDDFRLAAIKTYLRLGFRPCLRHENQRRRWREVFAELGDPEAAERFHEILAGPLDAPEPEYPDQWDVTQLRPRRVWHPHRPRRMKPAGGGTTDALGEESLYSGSQWGRAGIDASHVQAGEDRAFTLWYRTGVESLGAGTVVRFCMRGQRSFGDAPPGPRSERTGFVEVTGPAGVELTPLNLGFRVKSGRLEEDDVVQVAVGGKRGFRWTELAGRREFKVTIDTHPDEPQRRLPEPVVVYVSPRQPVRLELLLPGTIRAGSELRATVSARDRFDNRAPLTGEVTIETGEKTQAALLVDGRATLSLPSSSAPLVRARASHPEIPPETESNPCLCEAAPMLAQGAPYAGRQLYFGDLHCHDFLSEAEGYPDQVYTWARDEKRLDFVSVSVQSHGYHENDKWVLVKHCNERFLDEGRFVTFLAFEWQHSHYGDKVVHYLGGDQPYLPVDEGRYNTPAKLYEALRGSDALVISHHPAYPLDRHVPGTDWTAVETDVDRLAELWSMHGSSEGYDPADRPLSETDSNNTVLAALRAGVRVGLVAGSDSHSGRPGGSAREPRPHWGGLVAVWAESLTRRGVFAALRARRTVALTQARIVLLFAVNDQPMGAELPPADRAHLVAEVHAPGVIAEVELLRNGEVLHTVEPGAKDCFVEHSDRPDPTSPTFYHCRVTQTDGELAVCSPVWVG